MGVPTCVFLPLVTPVAPRRCVVMTHHVCLRQSSSEESTGCSQLPGWAACVEGAVRYTGTVQHPCSKPQSGLYFVSFPACRRVFRPPPALQCSAVQCMCGFQCSWHGPSCLWLLCPGLGCVQSLIECSAAVLASACVGVGGLLPTACCLGARLLGCMVGAHVLGGDDVCRRSPPDSTSAKVLLLDLACLWF